MTIFLSFHQWNFPTADSSSSLRVLQSVCTVVLHLIKTNVSCLLPFCPVGLPSAIFTEWFQNKPNVRSTYQVSTPFADNALIIVLLHCSSAIFIRCELNLIGASCKQSRIYLRFNQSPVTKTRVTNMWWYHLFFITTFWPVKYRRNINPKKALQSTLRV